MVYICAHQIIFVIEELDILIKRIQPGKNIIMMAMRILWPPLSVFLHFSAMTTKLIDGVKDFVKQDFIVLKLLQLLVLLV